MLAAGGVDAIPKFQKIFDNKYRYDKDIKKKRGNLFTSLISY